MCFGLALVPCKGEEPRRKHGPDAPLVSLTHLNLKGNYEERRMKPLTKVFYLLGGWGGRQAGLNSIKAFHILKKYEKIEFYNFKMK